MYPRQMGFLKDNYNCKAGSREKEPSAPSTEEERSPVDFICIGNTDCGRVIIFLAIWVKIHVNLGCWGNEML